jgi:hypothetical protein
MSMILPLNGALLHDDELITYLLVGLDKDYNVFTAVMAWSDPISLSEMYAQLMRIKHHTSFHAIL